MCFVETVGFSLLMRGWLLLLTITTEESLNNFANTEVQTHALSPQHTVELYNLAVIPAQGWLTGGQVAGLQGLQDLRHSGSMHFSTCSSSSLQSPSSARDLSIRWRVRMPFPQVTLQSLHSDHGDSKQGMVSRPRVRFATENRPPLRSLISLCLPPSGPL